MLITASGTTAVSVESGTLAERIAQGSEVVWSAPLAFNCGSPAGFALVHQA
jgi:hypothetical protein